MTFNSLTFGIFFAIVYALYLCLRAHHRMQNLLLLLASYTFYASWDPRFLTLLILSTLFAYVCALLIDGAKTPRQRKYFLYLSVIVNLSVLGFFKYFNFFAGNVDTLLRVLGIRAESLYLDIVLPLGISFYTFQKMSYTIDVFRKEIKPTRNLLDFALFASFFPQLVAGPIERAKNLLPQVLQPRQLTLEKFYEGCFLIFWGIFQKAFVADNLAMIVNYVYAGSAPFNGLDIYIATFAFTFQIYCDFAGYSNIARGLAKVLGFELMLNFNLPFFASNIQDYWNRWHISLSTWLRDYLYIPLFRWLRNVRGNLRIFIALMVTMTLIGLWHGAAWRFVAFGMYYGMLLSIYVVIRLKCANWVKPQSRLGQQAWLWARIVFVFHLVMIGMLIFRAPRLPIALQMLEAVIFNFHISGDVIYMVPKIIYFTWVLIAAEALQYYKQDLMCIYKSNVAFKTAFYLICYFLLTLQGVANQHEFIYFQF